MGRCVPLLDLCNDLLAEEKGEEHARKAIPLYLHCLLDEDHGYTPQNFPPVLLASFMGEYLVKLKKSFNALSFFLTNGLTLFSSLICVSIDGLGVASHVLVREKESLAKGG